MAQSIRISDDLYALAQRASQALNRPLAQQMEYWARLGAALDAAGISAAAAMQLLGNGASADEFVKAALGGGATADAGLPMLKDRLRKDADDVRAGRRPARSLWAIQEGGLEGYTFTPSRTSEFDQVGKGW
ncbi:MAG: hypothetical protein EOP39_22425 [Rubrivivax sp.]|nr:MAG: hypothetical protein EOP39_22425 [Rubrivivax sp.]